MRFSALAAVLLLAACSSGGSYQPKPVTMNDLGQAQAHCLSKGYVRGTFEYDTCYRNTPQVQAQERNGRLQSLAIISKNQSQSGYGSRSYPVE